jgi:hypothetical protein
MEDEKVARAREIGINLAKAAKDISSAAYKSEPGICPHCHSRNFFLNDSSSEAICCLSDIIGEIKVIGNYVKELIDTFSDNGGLIVDGSIEGIPSQAKMENVMAMIETAHNYGKY